MNLETTEYEFDAKYMGGPADGLEIVIPGVDHQPPETSCVELYNLIETRTPLGKHFFKYRSTEQTRVGVYILDREPDDYEGREQLTYQFIEMMCYGDYVSKYGDD